MIFTQLLIHRCIIYTYLLKLYNYIYIYICYLLFSYFIWWSPFIPSRNLDDIFINYNHIAILSFRSSSHVNASMVLTRADHLFIHNYIRSLLHIILRSILMVRRTGLEPASYNIYIGTNLEPTACMSDAIAN